MKYESDKNLVSLIISFWLFFALEKKALKLSLYPPLFADVMMTNGFDEGCSTFFMCFYDDDVFILLFDRRIYTLIKCDNASDDEVE